MLDFLKKKKKKEEDEEEKEKKEKRERERWEKESSASFAILQNRSPEDLLWPMPRRRERPLAFSSFIPEKALVSSIEDRYSANISRVSRLFFPRGTRNNKLKVLYKTYCVYWVVAREIVQSFFDLKLRMIRTIKCQNVKQKRMRFYKT